TAVRRVTSTDYDPAGDVEAVTSGQSDNPAYAHVAVTHYEHDALGRVTEVTVGYGSGVDQTTTTTYDRAGHGLDVEVPGGAVTRTGYDPSGRPDSVTEALGSAVERTTLTSYDDAGEVETVTGPLGDVTRYGYDALGRLTKTTEAEGRPEQRVTQ